jgi:hypothetical protein
MSRDMGRDRTQEVVGSSPISSTNSVKNLRPVCGSKAGAVHAPVKCGVRHPQCGADRKRDAE